MRHLLTLVALATALSLCLASPSSAQFDGRTFQASPAPHCLGSGSPNDLGKPPEGQNIENGPCSLVCGPSTSCSFACIDDNEDQSDCGDYGACDPCREALVEINRVAIGRKAKTVFWGFCEFKWHYNVTYQSVNSSSCQTYTYCETETETHSFWPEDLFCCDHIPGGCFGTSCP